MYADCKNWVLSCSSCQQKRGFDPRKKAPLQRQEIPTEPFGKIGIDFIGPLPTSDKGNKYILTVVDYLTKWVECFPLKDQKAETVADTLITEIFARYGLPSKLLSDRGSNFLSKLMYSVYDKLNIKKLNTSSFHPMTSGQVEAANKSIIQILSHLVDDHQRNWDDMLPYALWSYRTSLSVATQETPFFLLFGYSPRLPTAVLTDPQVPTYASMQSYAGEMSAKMRAMHTLVQEQLLRAAERQEQYYNQAATDREFQIGDRCYLHTPQVKPGRTKKLAKLNTGVYRVTAKLSPVSYEVTHEKNRRDKKIVHVNRLFSVQLRRETLVEREQQTPQSEDDEGPQGAGDGPRNRTQSEEPSPSVQEEEEEVAQHQWRAPRGASDTAQPQNLMVRIPLDMIRPTGTPETNVLHPRPGESQQTDVPTARYNLRPIPGRSRR